jgi:hypothetical protein
MHVKTQQQYMVTRMWIIMHMHVDTGQHANGGTVITDGYTVTYTYIYKLYKMHMETWPGLHGHMTTFTWIHGRVHMDI